MREVVFVWCDASPPGGQEVGDGVRDAILDLWWEYVEIIGNGSERDWDVIVVRTRELEQLDLVEVDLWRNVCACDVVCGGGLVII